MLTSLPLTLLMSTKDSHQCSAQSLLRIIATYRRCNLNR